MGWPILGDPIYGHGKRQGNWGHPRRRCISTRENRRADAGPQGGDRGRGPGAVHMRAAMAACGWVREFAVLNIIHLTSRLTDSGA